MTPEILKRLAQLLSTLPGIGPRHAMRLSFHLASRSKGDIKEFSQSIDRISDIKTCEQCFTAHENKGSLCSVCSDKNRDQKTIAIVERETDLISLEKSKGFNGRYLVIGELPKNGILTDQHKARLATIKKYLPEGADEVIIALSPTTYGDINATSIAKELNGISKKITRLGRGIPTGGEVEFADEQTLSEALKNRG